MTPPSTFVLCLCLLLIVSVCLLCFYIELDQLGDMCWIVYCIISEEGKIIVFFFFCLCVPMYVFVLHLYFTTRDLVHRQTGGKGVRQNTAVRGWGEIERGEVIREDDWWFISNSKATQVSDSLCYGKIWGTLIRMIRQTGEGTKYGCKRLQAREGERSHWNRADDFKFKILICQPLEGNTTRWLFVWNHFSSKMGSIIDSRLQKSGTPQFDKNDQGEGGQTQYRW